MIDLSPRPSGGLAGSIAGEGPREVVSVFWQEGGKAREVWHEESDADRLELDCRDLPAGPASFFIQVLEPGPRGEGRAWALLRGFRD
jgi:hypothetical protein